MTSKAALRERDAVDGMASLGQALTRLAVSVGDYAFAYFEAPRRAAERACEKSIRMMAAAPNARGPLIAYVVASSINDELILREGAMRRVATVGSIPSTSERQPCQTNSNGTGMQ